MNCSHVIAYHDRDAAGTAGVAGCAGIAGTAAAAGLAGLPLAPATQPTTIPRGRGSFRPGTGRSACHEATPLRPKIERRHAPSHVADRVSVHPATDTVGPVVNRVSNSYPFRNLLLYFAAFTRHTRGRSQSAPTADPISPARPPMAGTDNDTTTMSLLCWIFIGIINLFSIDNPDRRFACKSLRHFVDMIRSKSQEFVVIVF